jgi:CMP-N-acetylneuraminic acid synthetase
MTTSKTLSEHLAIIPARAGSKRLKNKNLKKLGGSSLIERTVSTALQANLFDRVIVSTDSEEIADLATRSGAEVPYLRPTALAEDDSSPVDVGIELINSLSAQSYTTLTWLQPTSPFRTSADIVAAHEIYRERGANCVISVCECEHSPLWATQLPDTDNLHAFIDAEALRKRSQDLPPYFRMNGAIYIVNVPAFLQQQSFYIQGKSSFAYKMPQQRSIDIDTLWDFELAEFILSREQSS